MKIFIFVLNTLLDKGYIYIRQYVHFQNNCPYVKGKVMIVFMVLTIVIQKRQSD